eukprot:1927052-Pyramimonas_sp.AAC.1
MMPQSLHAPPAVKPRRRAMNFRGVPQTGARGIMTARGRGGAMAAGRGDGAWGPMHHYPQNSEH